MMRALAVALGLSGLTFPATAQVLLSLPETTPEVQTEAAASAPGATVRSLDKISGAVADVALLTGETKAFGRLQITLGDCRYPLSNPSGDAYAFLVIRNAGEDVPAFSGWMIASSPALNALEHPRYDVWVLRCNN